jgi:16S rRNA (uracil1498-N3)-methyltransferase
MVRVFVDAGSIDGGELRLTGAEARHLGGALRMQPREELVAVTPDGIEHRCRVTRASATEVVALVLDSSPSRREPSRRVRLCQALLKGDQFDRILEYAGELGVDSVQALITERTVARPDATKLAARRGRWQQIVRQGAELGQRGRLPEVLPAAALADATETATADGLRTFLLYEGPRLPSLAAADLGEDGVCIIVGPEGGWSEAEVKLAERSGALVVSLGPRVMRPLPAALTALAVIYHRSGDLELMADPEPKGERELKED